MKGQQVGKLSKEFQPKHRVYTGTHTQHTRGLVNREITQQGRWSNVFSLKLYIHISYCVHISFSLLTINSSP